jgi:glucan biosynthesis protein
MYVFSLKSLYKTENAIFHLKFYHVKDYFFLKLKINMVDSF